MNLKNNCRFIGLGNYGGKQVKEFYLLNYKVIAAIGSEQDLKVLGDIPKYHLNGFDGFGGDREKTLACLEQNPEFLRFMSNIDEEIIFLVFSDGGSFGSGCATILAEMLAQDTNEELAKSWKTADYNRKKEVAMIMIHQIIISEDGSTKIIWNKNHQGFYP